ncbi:MAG: ABC transporter ATP-binding protein [Candidatus Shapirobacteria bacterium]|nr:ABC transporter ATP-binding protein [Candidatus Shapirobacteria bacterium]
MISIKNLSFSYPTKSGKVSILNNINFNIKKGEFVSILGHSGCGKTTLVKILSGYLEPQTGEVLINNIFSKKPSKKRIMVNQEDDLFPWMTVYENIKLVSNDEKNISKYLKLTGLIDYKNYYANHLSWGMKKRLSLARGLAVNPEFLILDEPFSSLDYQTRENLLIELDNIFSLTQKTILLVTHDIDEAIYLSDRIIVLSDTPATIKNEIKIDFPHPREISIVNSKKFIDIKNKIKNHYK